MGRTALRRDQNWAELCGSFFWSNLPKTEMILNSNKLDFIRTLTELLVISIKIKKRGNDWVEKNRNRYARTPLYA